MEKEGRARIRAVICPFVRSFLAVFQKCSGQKGNEAMPSGHCSFPIDLAQGFLDSWRSSIVLRSCEMASRLTPAVLDFHE
jgi:hypothetical protein